MAIIAEEFEFVVGVDTHARTHTFTAVHASTGAVVDTAAFPATSAGMGRAITWIRRRTGGERVFAAVEGTSSYGARLTQVLLAADIEVGEVRPPTRSSRALTGKSDPRRRRTASGLLRHHDPAQAQPLRRPSAQQGLRRHRPHPDELRHHNQGLRDSQPGNREIKPGDPTEPQTLRLPLHLPATPNHHGLTEPIEESF
jgi:hypothetical protein